MISRNDFNAKMEAEFSDEAKYYFTRVIVETPDGVRYPVYDIPKWLEPHVTPKREVSNGKTVYLVDIAD